MASPSATSPTATSPLSPILKAWERKMIDYECGGGRVRKGSASDNSPLPSRLAKRKRMVSPTTNSPASHPQPNFPGTEENEPNAERAHCSFVLDYDRSNLDNKHIIIPFDAFIKFIDSNFVCKFCQNSKSTYQRQTLGIATSINWFCSCRAGGSIKARLREKDGDRTIVWNESNWARLQPASRFELNTRFVLGLQQCGGGPKDAAVHAAMLDLSIDPFHNSWSKIEEEIAVVEVELGKKIVKDNVRQEAKTTLERKKVLVAEYLHNPFKYRPTKFDQLTEPGSIVFFSALTESEPTYSAKAKVKKDVAKLLCKPCTPRVPERIVVKAQKTGLSVQGDCRWDQRKGGRSYNSDSGTHLLVGNETMKCVAVAM